VSPKVEPVCPTNGIVMYSHHAHQFHSSSKQGGEPTQQIILEYIRSHAIHDTKSETVVIISKFTPYF